VGLTPSTTPPRVVAGEEVLDSDGAWWVPTGDGLPGKGNAGAPNTWFEFSPFAETDYDIVTERKLSDIGDFTYADGELWNDLDDPPVLPPQLVRMFVTKPVLVTVMVVGIHGV
jgi:hypothetical protein